MVWGKEGSEDECDGTISQTKYTYIIIIFLNFPLGNPTLYVDHMLCPVVFWIDKHTVGIDFRQPRSPEISSVVGVRRLSLHCNSAESAGKIKISS
jgi:hypothetical protein